MALSPFAFNTSTLYCFSSVSCRPARVRVNASHDVDWCPYSILYPVLNSRILSISSFDQLASYSTSLPPTTSPSFEPSYSSIYYHYSHLTTPSCLSRYSLVSSARCLQVGACLINLYCKHHLFSLLPLSIFTSFHLHLSTLFHCSFLDNLCSSLLPNCVSPPASYCPPTFRLCIFPTSRHQPQLSSSLASLLLFVFSSLLSSFLLFHRLSTLDIPSYPPPSNRSAQTFHYRFVFILRHLYPFCRQTPHLQPAPACSSQLLRTPYALTRLILYSVFCLLSTETARSASAIRLRPALRCTTRHQTPDTNDTPANQKTSSGLRSPPTFIRPILLSASLRLSCPLSLRLSRLLILLLLLFYLSFFCRSPIILLSFILLLFIFFCFILSLALLSPSVFPFLLVSPSSLS